jgi:hypothetical protein
MRGSCGVPLDVVLSERGPAVAFQAFTTCRRGVVGFKFSRPDRARGAGNECKSTSTHNQLCGITHLVFEIEMSGARTFEVAVKVGLLVIHAAEDCASPRRTVAKRHSPHHQEVKDGEPVPDAPPRDAKPEQMPLVGTWPQARRCQIIFLLLFVGAVAAIAVTGQKP